MKKLFVFIVVSLVVFSCKNNSEEKQIQNPIGSKNYEAISQLQWLLGTWTHTSGEEFSQETWSQENDSTFTAFSFTQVKGETVFAETIALEQLQDSLMLTVVAANQNKEKPVTFKLVSKENGRFVFENKKHDFPQRITYTNPVKDSLHARIEGNVNGALKKVDFYFSREK